MSTFTSTPNSQSTSDSLTKRCFHYKVTSERLIEDQMPFFNRLILIFGLLVSTIGVLGVAGHFAHLPILTSWGHFSNAISPSTAVAVLFLGLGLKTILNSHPHHAKPVWLWALRFSGWGVPLLIGGYWMIQYLQVPTFDILDISTYGLEPVSFLTATYLIASGLALLLFLTLQKIEFVVAYLVGIPAFIIFNIGLLAIVGYLYHEPLLYGYQLALPSGAAATITGAALMIGTLPYRGLLIPLFSEFQRVRWVTALSILLGLGLILFTMNSVALFLKQSHWMDLSLTSKDMRHFYTGLILTAGLVAITIKTLGLRAGRYLNQFMSYAHLQESSFEQEQFKRRLQSLVTQSEDFNQTLPILTQQIAEYFKVDRCLLVFYDEQIPDEISRLEQYARPPLMPVQLEDLPTHSKIVGLAPPPMKESVVLVQYNKPEDFPVAYQAYAQKYKVQAALGFDLFQRGRFYGRLALNHCHNTHYWTDEEYALLHDISQIVGIAIRQAALLEIEKTAQRRLSQTEKRFRLLIEGVKDYAIYFEDAQGIIHTWNSGAERVFGYPAEEILGQAYSRFLPPYEIEAGLFEHELEVAAKEGSFEIEGWRIRKDGSQFYAHIVLTALFEDGKLLGYSNITHDITEQKQAEALIQESQQKLAESNRDLEQFAAIASHDLQAPLRKVQVFCDMIYENAKEKLDPATLDLLERSKRALAQGQLLVNDLLALAVVSKEERPLRPIELSKAVYRVLNNLDQEIREKQARVTIESSVSLWADEFQLEQLLQNLIGNALKYQPLDHIPEIRIKAGCEDAEYCQFSVQDNGIGIPEERQSMIFEPFKRLHGKHSAYSGSGVGLAICKRIVERHQGRLWVESEPGKGSRFIVQLPKFPNAGMQNSALGRVLADSI